MRLVHKDATIKKKPHDTRHKVLFGNKKALLSLLKDCVKVGWISDLDEGSLKRSEVSFILQDFKKKETSFDNV